MLLSDRLHITSVGFSGRSHVCLTRVPERKLNVLPDNVVSASIVQASSHILPFSAILFLSVF